MADKDHRFDRQPDKEPSLWDEDMTVEGSYNKEYNNEPNDERLFLEETAAEPAIDSQVIKDNDEGEQERAVEENTNNGEGTGIGWLALALSIIALFFLPVIMGAAGIIIGIIARRQGAGTLGAWAIGVGAAAIVITLFAAPFL